MLKGVNLQSITFGNGCFWCLEAELQRIKGVTKITSGYAGGTVSNPTYEQVSTGTTGHAEVVQAEFDADIISLDDMLRIFWTTHNPTTLNRAGNDTGPQYRSIILYANDEQRVAAEKTKAQQQANWDDPIITQIVPLDHFWPAEADEQNYYNRHPESAYCAFVINPKLQKLKMGLKSLLKLKEEYQS
jgi:peptide-methionine (S)-S-oxide reductase